MNYKMQDSYSLNFLNYLKSNNRNPETVKKFFKPVRYLNRYDGYEVEMCNGNKRINYFIGNKKYIYSEEGIKIAPIILFNDVHAITLDKHIIPFLEGESDMGAVIPFSHVAVAILGAQNGNGLLDFSDDIKKALPGSEYKLYILSLITLPVTGSPVEFSINAIDHRFGTTGTIRLVVSRF